MNTVLIAAIVIATPPKLGDGISGKEDQRYIEAALKAFEYKGSQERIARLVESGQLRTKADAPPPKVQVSLGPVTRDDNGAIRISGCVTRKDGKEGQPSGAGWVVYYVSCADEKVACFPSPKPLEYLLEGRGRNQLSFGTSFDPKVLAFAVVAVTVSGDKPTVIGKAKTPAR